MTITRQPTAGSPSTQRAEDAPRPHRLVAVGVRDPLHDRAALEWVAADLAPDAAIGGDGVHVVHAFRPLRLEGCSWGPVLRARDARYLAARRVVARSVQRLAEGRPALHTEGSAVAGVPVEVLVELSEVVDLLVIGDDSGAPGRHTLSWQVQDAAGCPVVCVPPGCDPQRAGPVTVLADERGLPQTVMAFAVESAARHGAALQVVRPWAALHEGADPGPAWLAEQQEELDAQLADWRDRHPHLGIVGRIELGEDWLPRLRDGSRLLVVGVRSAAAARAPDGGSRCPTAVVPDGD